MLAMPLGSPYSRGLGAPTGDCCPQWGQVKGPSLHLAGTSTPNEEMRLVGVCGREFLDHRRRCQPARVSSFLFLGATQFCDRNARAPCVPGRCKSDLSRPSIGRGRPPAAAGVACFRGRSPRRAPGPAVPVFAGCFVFF